MKLKVNVGLVAGNSDDWERVQAKDWTRQPKIPDWKMVQDAFSNARLAEGLGYDGVWAAEHFGTPYGMSPNPLQALAYFAGATEHINLGTMLVIVPWWNPIRLAHQIAFLDIMSNGRYTTIGLGRGVAKSEFDSLGVPREESTQRLVETLDILELAFTQERFSYDGEIFKIPEMSLRPKPKSTDLFDRLYGGSATGPTLELISRRGLKPLLIGNKPLAEAAKDVQKVNTIRAEMGFEPCQPRNLMFTYCAPTRDAAKAAVEWLDRANIDVMNAYGLNDPSNFQGVKGYETYANRLGNATANVSPEELRRRLTGNDGAGEKKAMPAYDQSNFLIGTPDQLIERIGEAQKASSFTEITLITPFGNMPYDKARASIELFGKEVLPTVQQINADLHEAALPQAEVAA